MNNKIKAALITLLIMGAFAFVIIACIYSLIIFVKIFVGALGIIAASALFYAVYVAVLHDLNVKDEHKIGGDNE
jgi:hypothetical protein